MNNDWISISHRRPPSSGRYKVLVDGLGVRFADYNEAALAWQCDGDVVSWKDIDSKSGQTPVSSIVKDDLYLIGDTSDKEMQALIGIAEAEIHRTVDNIEISVSTYVVNDDANIATAGRVLAISERYAAQRTGVDSMVVHEVGRLDTRVMPGDDVTIDYKDGLASVYAGVRNAAIVRISSADLLREEIKMIEDAVSITIDGLVGRMSDLELQKAITGAIKHAVLEMDIRVAPDAIRYRRTTALEEQSGQLSPDLDGHRNTP